MCTSGGGTLFTISGVTLVGRLNTIGPHAEDNEPIEDTVIASKAMEYCPGDIVDYGNFQVTYPMETSPDSRTDWDKLKIEKGTVTSGTATITFGDGWTLSGTGFLRGRGMDPIERGDRVLFNYVWQWDGKNPPVYANPSP